MALLLLLLLVNTAQYRYLTRDNPGLTAPKDRASWDWYTQYYSITLDIINTAQYRLHWHSPYEQPGAKRDLN